MSDGPLLAGQAFDLEAATLALTYQAIVRDLALADPTTETGHDMRLIVCGLCGADSHQDFDPNGGAVVHDEDCPWLRARRFFPEVTTKPGQPDV